MAVETEEKGRAEAARRIAACAESGAETLDLGRLMLPEVPESVAALTWLKTLDLDSNSIGADGAQALAALTNLTNLNLSFNGIGDDGAQALAALTNLTNLNLSFNGIGAVGAQALAALTELTNLNLSFNGIGAVGAQALAALTNLTNLNLDGNSIGADGAQALAALTELTTLSLNSNGIGDVGAQALAALTNLTTLNLDSNGIGDAGAQALAALTNLTTLNLYKNSIGTDGAQAIAALTNLTDLNLGSNSIGTEGAQAIAALVNLTDLSLDNNSIGDEGAQAIAALTNLTDLNLDNNSIGDEGAQAIAALTNLIELFFSFNDISSIQIFLPLKGLTHFRISGCAIRDACPEFWFQPDLHTVGLVGTKLADVPPEVTTDLSTLRAHFRDLELGTDSITDVKFMILGNGRIGKTQICRRLRNEDFDESVESTHGILITSAPLPEQHDNEAPTTLKIWDFGGQDIYLGTHALFLKSRALFPIVWTPGSEDRDQHIHDDEPYRNYPLDYWVQYVRQMAGKTSPLLLIQNQVDGPTDTPQRPPLSQDRLDQLVRHEVVAYSAKTKNRHASLIDALHQLVQWMRATQPSQTIGIGRARVKRCLEDMQQTAQKAREAGQPDLKQALITWDRYRAICRKAGNVSSPEHLLDYLHQIGVVFHDKELFTGHIVVDQQWALDAIYSVFDRESRAFQYFRDVRSGRFTKAELAAHVWTRQGHGSEQQALFLKMMRSCNICFQVRTNDDGQTAEYVAPELLPPRGDIAGHLVRDWDDGIENRTAKFSYDFLPPQLLHSAMAEFGEKAGMKADYWCDGFYFYDTRLASRAIIQETRVDDREKKDWSGAIQIRTQEGHAVELLARICSFVDAIQHKQSISANAYSGPEFEQVNGYQPIKSLLREPSRFKNPRPRRETFESDEPDAKPESASEQAQHFSPGNEPGKKEYFVSYSWGRGGSEEDRLREVTVDKLCAIAEERGIHIIRDKHTVKFGESISQFMSRLAKGERIFVVLSKKYLESEFCMFELHEIFREARGKDDEFLKRVKLIVLPSAKIFTPPDRLAIVRFWTKKNEEYELGISEFGVNVGLDSFRKAMLVRNFMQGTADLLALVADIRNPQHVDEIPDDFFDD